jgi:hypothetical protein
MEIILQHERSGLFLGGEREWVAKSQDARKFASGNEAVRFAHAARFAPEVRMVARYERNRLAILLPLMGTVANCGSHTGYSSDWPR